MELLVRIVDRGSAVDDAKAGDVIAACPDGWAWSEAERTNPDWRIIRADVLEVTVAALLSRNTPPGKPLRRRDWVVDFSRLPTPALFSGARAQPIVSVTRGQFMAAIARKPEL